MVCFIQLKMNNVANQTVIVNENYKVFLQTGFFKAFWEYKRYGIAKFEMTFYEFYGQ